MQYHVVNIVSCACLESLSMHVCMQDTVPDMAVPGNIKQGSCTGAAPLLCLIAHAPSVIKLLCKDRLLVRSMMNSCHQQMATVHWQASMSTPHASALYSPWLSCMLCMTLLISPPRYACSKAFKQSRPQRRMSFCQPIHSRT